MKRSELSIWAILIAASIVGSVVAASIPNQEPKVTNKQVKHAPKILADDSYASIATRSQSNNDASSAKLALQ